MKRVLAIAIVATVIVASSPTNGAAGLGPAAYYDPSYSYNEWLRIFNLHVGWGNAIPNAMPSVSGYWCVHPDRRVGETLTVTANGTSITCTIGDMVQPHHVSAWRSRWSIELSYNAFVALGLTSRNMVDSISGTTSPYVSDAPIEYDQRVRYFEKTGFVVGHGFLDFWTDHGGIRIFGYPLSNEVEEDGMTVQYFERAVFEYHPSNDHNYRILLRRVGAEVLDVN